MSLRSVFLTMSGDTPTGRMTLRDIRRACGLGPLVLPEHLRKFWVDTDAARSTESGLRNRVKKILEDENDVRMLVYGHGGCGKSTELSKLISELGDNYFVVRFSIRNEMNLTAVQAEDILLVLAERLLSAAQNSEIPVNDSVLKPVHDYFSTVERSVNKDRISSIGASGDASVGTGFLGPLVKLLVGVKGEIKLNVHSTDTVTAELRKRPADLIAQVNVVINAVRQAVRRDQRLLLIVEDLDKLDIASARRVFIENANLLSGIAADIVYTVPIFTFHSPDADILRKQFRPVGLQMIKVTELDGKPAPGFEVVKRIVYSRIGSDSVLPDAVDHLIEKTGGVLQHVLEALRNAALLDSAEVPLNKHDIEEALKHKRREFWSEITLPSAKVEGVDSIDQLYKRLADYAIRQLDGKTNPPEVDAINQILLRSCALVEYNGEGWYGVHPLVIDNLRQLGRI
jgi:hypothetical protein